MTDDAEIEVLPSSDSGNDLSVIEDLGRFEAAVINTLRQVGLPETGVFVDVDQRRSLFRNIGYTLEPLSKSSLACSFYLSKMVAAASVGLFDAALNYLWDETIGELRRRVDGFDLAYFFDVAVPNSDKRKHLKNADDLPDVDDASLLRGCHAIGLMTDIGYERLNNIRFMRNHASAAHPNQTQLTGLDLANWLEVCINHVINTEPDYVTAETGRLLGNIKKVRLDQSAVKQTTVFFGQLPADRADTLGNGLFGLYVDPDRTPIVADNVRALWPSLWEYISDVTRFNYGVRIARYSASADTGQATAARELLDLVDGSAYLTDETRLVELDIALDELISAHEGLDNFYNEVPPARKIAELVGEHGEVPEQVSRKFVATIVQMYLGNGWGVSRGAEPIYQSLIELFTPESAARALRMFRKLDIAILLQSPSAKKQWSKLLDLLEPKLVSRRNRELIHLIRNSGNLPSQLRSDPEIQKFFTAAKRPKE
ncbi:hypothetical protein [Mycobacteroides abscessus]|uniref:hypothetical protein n=1 Tax=Mycobacteroides abscessus TaxID=36809 RepID=UPI0012FFE819|nr:hypothetical protein [Mycobacteroides abscessus]